jgi:effector-binding domain-containing protein
MEIKDLNEMNTLAIRVTVPVSNLPQTMGRIYGEIAAHMQERGIPFAGAPYARYYNMDMEALDVEIGFPVTKPAVGTDAIKPCVLPAGKALVEKHIGPYERIEEAYNRLMAYVDEQKLSVNGETYEFYLNDPAETKPEALETEIYFPVSG